MSIFKKLNHLKDIKSSISEDFEFFTEEFILSINKFKNFYSKENLKIIFNQIKNKDSLIIKINIQSNNIAFREINDIESTFKELNTNIYEEDDEVSIEFEVTKNSDLCNIYSFKNFIKWLVTSNINSFFDKIKKYNNRNEQIYFRILDEEEHLFYSSKFIFYSYNKSIDNLKDLKKYPNKLSIKENQKENCLFSNSNDITFLPDDFKLIEKSKNDLFNKLFNKICFFIIISYISNISEIKKNSMFFKIYGYKSISGNLKFESIIDDNILNVYFKIYEWIYIASSNSNTTDKLEISRNIISLHTVNNNICNINGDVFSSIKSNFNIYLKDNVQKYLEVKQQISSFIYDMSIKAEDYINVFSNTFKNNFLIFISYFLSIITLTAVDKGKFINVFSVEVTAITLIMLFFSCIYKKYTIGNLKFQIKRYKARYKAFKKSYFDILEKDNLNELFSHYSKLDEDVKYMSKSLKTLNNYWNWLIIILAVISIFFCIIHDTHDFSSYLIKLYFIF